MTEKSPPTPPSQPPGDAQNDSFMLQVARALSGARPERIFEDLTRSAAELLGAEIGLLGRYRVIDQTPSIETLAFLVNGRFLPNASYPLAGTPCETVIGQEFRFYPSNLGELFPHSDAQLHEVVGYAAFPLIDNQSEQMGLISVMSYAELQDSAGAESLLRIFAERAAAEIRRLDVEDALRASEERYRSIFDASVDGLALLDANGIIVDVNPAIERLYGYAREEMIGQKALNFTRGSHRAKAQAFLNTIEDQQFATMVDKAFHRDGSEYDVEPSGVTVNYQGQTHILAIVRDVTERARADAERTQLEIQLRQAQKMEAIGHLTGGVAHDFNNILTSVLGYVELAQDHVSEYNDARLDRYLERAQRSGERARDLIQQMLTFSRGQQGQPRPLGVADAVREALALLQSMLPAAVKIAANLEQPVPLVIQDPVHLEQVLINLSLNACEAMADVGDLSITLSKYTGSDQLCSSCRQVIRGAYVEISVCDSGSGIAPGLVDRIFEPFFSTKEVGRGSGMGLSTVHGIMHEYDGHVLVDSEPGEGTCMRVLMPVADRESLDRASTTAEAISPTRFHPLDGSVLLVDGNNEVTEFVADLLADWNLKTTAFDDPEAAYNYFFTHSDQFDVAIISHNLPSVTGSRLIELVHQQRPQLPIVLSGGNVQLDEHAMRRAGVTAFMSKPVDSADLHATLREILSAD